MLKLAGKSIKRYRRRSYENKERRKSSLTLSFFLFYASFSRYVINVVRYGTLLQQFHRAFLPLVFAEVLANRGFFFCKSRQLVFRYVKPYFLTIIDLDQIFWKVKDFFQKCAFVEPKEGLLACIAYATIV